MNQRQLRAVNREYEAKLTELVDDIYEAATDVWDFSWFQLANESGLAYNTVYRLGMRITRWPQLQTIFKLARAVGMDVNLVDRQLRMARRAA